MVERLITFLLGCLAYFQGRIAVSFKDGTFSGLSRDGTFSRLFMANVSKYFNYTSPIDPQTLNV